jgi:CTP:molybdopterin cytidylyltransferase MocA
VPIHVIITAGGELPPELQRAGDSRVKALLRVGEMTLLERAVAAAAESRLAGDIAVVGGEEVLRARPRDAAHVEAGASAVENLHRGFQHHGADLDAEYFVLSPDLPFITAQGVDAFLAAARELAEFAFPLVSGEDFLRQFPEAANKFERIDGAPATLGSCFYITGRMLQTNIPLFHDFFRNRRYPHRLAAMLGLPIALGYLTGRTRITQLEARARQLTGGTVRAIPVSDAGLAFDIDKHADLEYALRHLERSVTG